MEIVKTESFSHLIISYKHSPENKIASYSLNKIIRVEEGCTAAQDLNFLAMVMHLWIFMI